MAEVEDKESLARSQLPYRAEYCKTSRAKCKKCSETMEGGSLKVANMVKSRFHDGYDANYYHTKCFFTIKRPTTVAEIANYETLKYEDQKMLEKAIETNGKSLLLDGLSPEAKKDLKSGGKGKRGSKKRDAAEELVNYNDFLVEYAKSSRAKCVACEQVITKGDIRFGKMDYGADTGTGFAGPVPRWYHKDCFAKSLEQVDFYGLVENIPTFCDLEKDDQKMLRKQIKPISPPKLEDSNGNGTAKKVKVDEEAELEERALKQQSDRFYALMSQVEKVRVVDLRDLLKFMEQKYDIKTNAILYKQATDVLLYGPLKRCPKCKKSGTMMLRNSSYICTQDDCDYETRDPERSAPDFPEDFTDRYEYFAEDYEFKGGKRVFPRKFLQAVEQKEAEDNNLAMADAPLQGLDIGIITWNAVKNGKEKVQKKIITLGAKATTVMASSVFVILSNENELDKVTPKMEVAKGLNIPFARDDFLFNIKTREDVVPQLKKSMIGNWDGNLEERLERMSSAAAEAAKATGSADSADTDTQ